MSTKIMFWRQKRLSLDEIIILARAPFVNILSFFKNPGKYERSYYEAVNFDPKTWLQQVPPDELLYEGVFATVNLVHEDVSQYIRITVKFYDYDYKYGDEGDNLQAPVSALAEFIFERKAKLPSKKDTLAVLRIDDCEYRINGRAWSSPKEIREQLKTWQPNNETGKGFYQLFKTLSDLNFYCTIT